MLREPDWINGGLKDDGGIIDFSFAPGATWNVIPADSSTVSNYLHQEDELLFSEVTSLNLDTGANVYLGSMKSSWDFLPQGFTTSPFGTTSDMASTPVQLRTKELNGNGNFYLRTDLHQDISDSVLITESLSGSHTLHVKGGGSGDLIKEQTNSYLARTEFVNDGLGTEFSLAKNSHGQELVDLGVYNYRLNHSQRNNGREWYLVRETRLSNQELLRGLIPIPFLPRAKPKPRFPVSPGTMPCGTVIRRICASASAKSATAHRPSVGAGLCRQGPARRPCRNELHAEPCRRIHRLRHAGGR